MRFWLMIKKVGLTPSFILEVSVREQVPTMDRNCALKDLGKKTELCFGKNTLPPPLCQLVKACVKGNF